MSFLLITAPPKYGGLRAIHVLKSRIKTGLYPLNESTKFRRDIKPGHRIFFYLGASNRKKSGYDNFHERGKSIAGEAVVEEKINEFRVSREDKENVHADLLYVSEFLKLQQVQLYSDAIPFEKLACDLSFTRRSADWRACLMGGAKKIDKDDILLIQKNAKYQQP